MLVWELFEPERLQRGPGVAIRHPEFHLCHVLPVGSGFFQHEAHMAEHVRILIRNVLGRFPGIRVEWGNHTGGDQRPDTRGAGYGGEVT